MIRRLMAVAWNDDGENENNGKEVVAVVLIVCVLVAAIFGVLCALVALGTWNAWALGVVLAAVGLCAYVWVTS